ncbi:miz zinc finger protein [Colletotrichum karsti]|uniref:Miz zinc finger protein n=1 Tax=Colletotrichum karsti TaxID=1095194 RepID=A0A9P6IGH2_9PEZI|nr:miz zinc finger protein [Colletotrichum karsti]KAF9882393.1 miz zinc finger protein [Colletotrichum karsti]
MHRQGAQQNAMGNFLSGPHVAASNQTLNAWIGGRQPAWMTSQAATGPHHGSAPAGNTPSGSSGRARRPPSRSQRTPAQNAPDLSRLNHGNIPVPLETPTDAIHQTSAVVPELGKQTLDSAAALPSPAPTDQPSPPTAASIQPQTSVTDSSVTNPAQYQNPPFDQQPDIAAVGSGGTFTQGAAIIGQPLQSYGVLEASMPAESGQASALDSHTAARFALTEEDVRAVQAALDNASPSPPATAVNQIPSHQGSETPQRPPVPAVASMPELHPNRSHNSTPTAVQNTPVSSSTTHQPLVQPVSSTVQPPVGQPAAAPQNTGPSTSNQDNAGTQETVTQTTNTFNLRCLRQDVMTQKLNDIATKCGAPRLPADNTTGPRLKLLKDAVDVGDYFYLTLHQLLCVWSFSKPFVLHHLSEDPQVVESAMKIVQNTLRKNENMPQPIVMHLANFPESPQSGLWACEPYQRHIRSVAAFLRCLHNQWNTILIPSFKPQTGRGYPILAAELRYQLRLQSPVLEPVLFTVTRRHLGVPDGPVAEQMHQLFQSDQKFDYTRMSEQDQTNLRDTMIARYKQLVLESRGILSPTTMSNSPSVPNPPMGMSPALARQQQMIHHARRLSACAGNSSAQLAARSPNQNTSTQGFDMYPSQAPNNLVSMQQQYTLRSNHPPFANGVMQNPMYQAMTRTPVNGGQFSQPLTPSGSPLYGNTQLPNMGRMVHPQGQMSPGLQAPPGGISVSMPMVASPTQPTAYPGVPNYVSTGFQGQRTSSTQQAYSQQALQAQQIRQGNQGISRQQGQTTMQSPLPNTASPQMYQMANAPPARSSPHQVQTSLPQVQASQIRPRASDTPTRPTVKERPALSGTLFRPRHHVVPLDQIPHSPYAYKAFTSALHQVDVRSPRRVPRELPLKDEVTARHYQSIKRLALGPVPTQPRYELHRLDLAVSNEDFDNLSTNRLPIGELVPVSQYFNGSLRYRLRLCQLPQGLTQTAVPESTWAVAPSYWPDHISIVVNGKPMKIRRKQHYSQHQPVELTAHLSRGMNTVSIGITPQPCAKKTPRMAYFMAVEVIETLVHQSLLDMVTQQGVIPAEITKKSLQKRLKSSEGVEDDDLTVVDSDLNVSVADPFTSTLFEIPVRGVECTHMECFDLATWLNTRPTKAMCTLHGEDCHLPCSGSDLGPEPSLVDRWKCPFCSGDARPCSLRVDQFMADIRTKLAADGLLRTKMVHVAADGSWRPKVEEETDDDETEDEANGPPAKRVKTGSSRTQTPATMNRAPIEIIELD